MRHHKMWVKVITITNSRETPPKNRTHRPNCGIWVCGIASPSSPLICTLTLSAGMFLEDMLWPRHSTHSSGKRRARARRTRPRLCGANVCALLSTQPEKNQQNRKGAEHRHTHTPNQQQQQQKLRVATNGEQLTGGLLRGLSAVCTCRFVSVSPLMRKHYVCMSVGVCVYVLVLCFRIHRVHSHIPHSAAAHHFTCDVRARRVLSLSSSHTTHHRCWGGVATSSVRGAVRCEGRSSAVRLHPIMRAVVCTHTHTNIHTHRAGQKQNGEVSV